MLTTVEKGLPHAQEEEKTALTHVAECRCESARPQSGQRESRRISDVDKARSTELEQLQEAHGQLQSDSESHIERQRELTTQVQNELEALRKQRQSGQRKSRRTLHQGPRLHEDKKGQKLRVDTPAAAASLRMRQRTQATSDSIDETALRTLQCPTRNPLTHSRDPTNKHNDPLPQPHPSERSIVPQACAQRQIRIRSQARNLGGFTNSPPFRISPPVINVKVLEAVKINNLHCSPPENTQSPTLGGRGTPGRQDIRPRRAGSGRDRGNSDGGNGVGSAACTDPRRDIRRQHNGRRSAH